MSFRIIEIEPGDGLWVDLLEAAPLINEAVLRPLNLEIEFARSSHILVALVGERPAGVLRFVTQSLGEDEERPGAVSGKGEQQR
jgi:hypothetical protein